LVFRPVSPLETGDACIVEEVYGTLLRKQVRHKRIQVWSKRTLRTLVAVPKAKNGVPSLSLSKSAIEGDPAAPAPHPAQPSLTDAVEKNRFCSSAHVRLIQDQAPMRNVDSKIHSP